jgi:hypothetical protein
MVARSLVKFDGNMTAMVRIMNPGVTAVKVHKNIEIGFLESFEEVKPFFMKVHERYKRD